MPYTRPGRYTPGLGVVPVVAATAVTAIPKLVGGLLSLGGLIKGSKDPQRLAANAKAYRDALTGQTSNFIAADGSDQLVPPLSFLYMKSPVEMGGQGGWATAIAQRDAWNKYLQAQKALTPAAVVGAAPAIEWKPGTPLTPAGSGTATGPMIAGAMSNPMLMLSLAGTGMFILAQMTKKKGRRR